MNDDLKMTINRLQNRIVNSFESDNILLIFDNQEQLEKYKRNKKYICPNELFTTINELCFTNFLDGKKYKQYWFMLDKDIGGVDNE